MLHRRNLRKYGNRFDAIEGRMQNRIGLRGMSDSCLSSAKGTTLYFFAMPVFQVATLPFWLYPGMSSFDRRL